MVNSKNVAFKVNKQSPATGPPPRAYATVINCRKPAGKRALQALRGEKEVKSRKVPLAGVGWTAELEKKRKRSEHENEDETNSLNKKFLEWESSPGAAYALATVEDNSSSSSSQTSQTLKPTRFRRGKTLSKGVDLDCWFTILTFSDPAQLLEMRTKIASCYRFLRDNPMLWKHSRDYYYGSDMPDPPHELTEFQYAHLRHGHGCMSCNTPSTRKTYWAFLRRWCKTCLQSKTIKEHDAMTLFKDANGEDISFIAKCLPSGIFDSWGNFVGVGPASTHSLKTIYLLSDVQKIVAEFIKESRENYISWHAEMRTWISNKVKIVEERREFARKMENWEDSTRTTKSFDYQAKKTARKAYFAEKAAQLHPPISRMIIEGCPSYRRAVAIPKEPNITSWLQLKPKLEKEWPEVAARLERERLERERLERERLERERLERERLERERLESERVERERLESERVERERLERERVERERVEREATEAAARLEREPTALATQGGLPSLHPPPPGPPFSSSGNLTPNNGIS